MFSPPNSMTELELVVFPPHRLSDSFHVSRTFLVLLVCATQGGYDRLSSTTNRHWESDEAMHQKLVATDVKQMSAKRTVCDAMSLVLVLSSFGVVELLLFWFLHVRFYIPSPIVHDERHVLVGEDHVVIIVWFRPIATNIVLFSKSSNIHFTSLTTAIQ